MDPVYAEIRKRAWQIAAQYPPPAFYRDFSEELRLSRDCFNTHPMIKDLYAFVAEKSDNDLGHGLPHLIKVSLDAGTLVLVEGKRAGMDRAARERAVVLIQSAGLLHDLMRKNKNHAEKGAENAECILEDFPLSDKETGEVCLAIRNHEAFKVPSPAATARGSMLSDCLYDADKFRWGPDNFTDTVWHMISFYNTPLSVFIQRYPEGLKGVERIKETFRSFTGKAYGPAFIELGLAIGEELYQVLDTEFKEQI